MIVWLLGLALAAPLTLDDVLSGLDDRLPELAAADAKARSAEGKALAARGAFDPKLKAKADRYLDGYDRTIAEAGLGAQTVLGPQVEGGWRLGVGDFPTYDGRKTASDGEWYVAADVPLLDGLILPEARADRARADANVLASWASRDDKLRRIRQKAIASWAKWAASGVKLTIQEAFVEQTAARQRALEREVEEGTRARLDALDNRRALEERRAELALAQQDLVDAAQRLSLYWRASTGQPQVPGRDQLPLDLAGLSLAPASEAAARDVAAARPDVRALDALVDAADMLARRERNALLPDLSVGAEAVRPADTELPAELIAGARLELATLFRKERGKLQAASADLAGLEALHRAALDQATAEIEASRSAVVQAELRRASSTAAAEAAREVLVLERRRFELGSGDIFTLLGRETKKVKADKDLIDAQLDLLLAEAALLAAEGR